MSEIGASLSVRLLVPPWAAVPRPANEGTESVAAGHQVILYATGDSTAPMAIARSFTTGAIDRRESVIERRPAAGRHAGLVLAAVLTAVLAAVLLGACSNSEGPAQSAGLPTALPPGSSLPDPAVAWSEQLCRVLLPVAQGAGTLPSLDTSDPEGSRQRFHTYLHNQVDALNTALAQIAAAGPAPVDKGPQVDQVLVTTLSRQRDALAAGTAELDAVPLRQPETLKSTLTAVTSLIVPTDGRTLESLAVPISLQPAARQAPSCQRLAASESAAGLPTRPAPIR